MFKSLFVLFLGLAFSLTAHATCNGANCGPLVDKATFDFNILSGGVDANVYVCQVGMKNHACYEQNGTKCADEDYLVVNYGNGLKKKISKVTNNPSNFGPFDNALSADVFLNSTHYGAGWYVKYCLDITRAVAGPLAEVDKLMANVNANIKLSPTWNNGYLADSQLKYKITYGCAGSTPVTTTPELLDGPDQENLCTVMTGFCPEGGDNCYKIGCGFMIEFKEDKTCARSIKGIDTNPCYGLDCELFGAKIHTEVNTSVDFSCTDLSCVSR